MTMLFLRPNLIIYYLLFVKLTVVYREKEEKISDIDKPSRRPKTRDDNNNNKHIFDPYKWC